jgi:pSer/pThr/pTyr-binding forkhead associated (FHA) protein
MRPLTVANGPVVGQEYEFRDSAVSVLGRAAECYPQLPDELPYKDVSRHHCLLDVRLPRLRLLDLGSDNGTFVNGARVRQPPGPDPAPEGDPAAATVAYEAAPAGWHPLEDGDVITLGGNAVLLVRVQARQEGQPPPGRRQPRLGTGEHLPGGRRRERRAPVHQG